MMFSRIATVLALVAMVTASPNIQEVAVNAEGEATSIDSVNLLQTPGAAVSHEEVLKHDAAMPDGWPWKPEAMKPEEVPTATKLTKLLQTTFEDALHGKGLDKSAALAEFVAMTLFVVIGCGSACAVAKEPGWVLQVSLSFGLGITALAYAVGHISGGQINPAVTFALVITGNLGWLQGIANFIAQLLGSILGASILMAMFPEDSLDGALKDKTGGLGANKAENPKSALIGEIVMTFLLVFVIFETAINPQSKANREMAAMAIGLAVFLAHCVMIPIDGCSINPARSFGPAVVRRLCYTKNPGSFSDMWIFWAGPLIGAAAAALFATSVLPFGTAATA